MQKSRRLIELMMLINKMNTFTASDLAKELDVSLRTIQRDIKNLEELGVPLYAETGPGGGYRVLNHILPPISFTESEALAMFFSYQSLKQYAGLPFQNDGAHALQKFYHHLPSSTQKRIDEMKNRVLFWTPKRTEEPLHLHEFLNASIQQNVIHVTYDSLPNPTTRKILPIGIYAQNGYWYCPAYCYMRADYRLFRVDRFIEITHVDQTPYFTNHLSLDNWFKDHAPKQTVKLCVSLTNQGIRRCQVDPWLSKHMVPSSTGGHIDTDLNIEDLEYYGDFFLSLGEDGIVEGPNEMISYIKTKIDTLSKLY